MLPIFNSTIASTFRVKKNSNKKYKMIASWRKIGSISAWIQVSLNEQKKLIKKLAFLHKFCDIFLYINCNY